MLKRLFLLFIGNTISALAVAMVVNAGLGCFPVTATNLSIANLTGLSMGVAGMIVELTMLLLATYKGEGIGLTAILNATYGSLMVDFFRLTIPSHTFMITGIIILPISWIMMGKAELGDTGSNILMNALLKSTGKSIRLIRSIMEVTFLLIGLLGAAQYVTWFSIVLSLGFGYIVQVIYKLAKYDPTKMNHSFIIKKSSKESHKIVKDI